MPAIVGTTPLTYSHQTFGHGKGTQPKPYPAFRRRKKKRIVSKIRDPHVDEKSTITSLELHLSCLFMGGLSASSVLDSRHSLHLHMVWLITLMRPSRASGSPIKRHPLNALFIESLARSYFSMAFFARAVESSLRLPRYLAEDLQRI